MLQAGVIVTGRGLALIFVSIVLVPLGVVAGMTVDYLLPAIWWAGVPVLAISMYCLLWGAYLELQELRK